MSRMNRKERRTLLMRVGAVLIAICMVAALALPAFASDTSGEEDTYSYTVRVFPGDKGTINGSKDPIVKTVEPGYEWSASDFDYGTQAASATEKYYVTGMREAGKDNNTNVNYRGGGFTVDRDIDLVISYGIKGSDVAYTIHYVEYGTNKVLHDANTYFGNVGDKPAVAYLHIEGYIPQYKNIEGTLDANADANDWTFYYVPVEEPDKSSNNGSTQAEAQSAAEASTESGTTSGGTSTGSRTSTGTSRSSGTSTGTSTGSGTSTGTSRSSGTSTGTSTGSGTSTGTSTGSGTSTGTSTGSGTSTGTSTGSGTSTGTSTGSDTSTGTAAGNNTESTAAGGAAAGTAESGSNTQLASNTPVNTRRNGPQEIVDVDEQETPLVEYEGEDKDEPVAEETVENVNSNSELEGVVRRSSGMSTPFKVVIGAAIVLVLAGAGWFFFRQFAVEDDDDE